MFIDKMAAPLVIINRNRLLISIKAQFKYALVWGTSCKYSPQRVGLTHLLHHDDVIQIIKK